MRDVNFFTYEDLKGINYIPQDKLQTLVQDLNRILQTKVGSNTDSWDAFYSKYQTTQRQGETNRVQ